MSSSIYYIHFQLSNQSGVCFRTDQQPRKSRRQQIPGEKALRSCTQVPTRQPIFERGTRYY